MKQARRIKRRERKRRREKRQRRRKIMEGLTKKNVRRKKAERKVG